MTKFLSVDQFSHFCQKIIPENIFSSIYKNVLKISRVPKMGFKKMPKHNSIFRQTESQK